MYASHYGLKEKFEISCDELDALVELASGVEGVLGAKMMGGWRGGCTINLVRRDCVKEFEQKVIEGYRTPNGG